VYTQAHTHTHTHTHTYTHIQVEPGWGCAMRSAGEGGSKGAGEMPVYTHRTPRAVERLIQGGGRKGNEIGGQGKGREEQTGGREGQSRRGGGGGGRGGGGGVRGGGGGGLGDECLEEAAENVLHVVHVEGSRR